MTPIAVSLVLSLIAPQVPTADEKAPAPNIAGETLGQISAKTGYSVEEIKTLSPPVQQWGGYGLRPVPGDTAESFAAVRFKKPPKPYVHPRSCCCPAGRGRHPRNDFHR